MQLVLNDAIMDLSVRKVEVTEATSVLASKIVTTGKSAHETDRNESQPIKKKSLSFSVDRLLKASNPDENRLQGKKIYIFFFCS